MDYSTTLRKLMSVVTGLALGLIAYIPAEACTRAVYLGPENTVITARSMDWPADMQTNLWQMPRGITRNGLAGANSIHWTAKYGSVAAAAWDIATADGMNEKGLVGNLLFLSESEYPIPVEGDTRKSLAISLWLQYALDNYATVAEAVAELRKEPFYIVTDMTPDGELATLKLSLSDPSGDSAIFEYVGGKLTIHHGRQYQIMTNSPVYDQQLALDKYWQEIGGTVFLPGTNRSADRFSRASFYIHATKQTANSNEAVAAAFSVIRNVSVPMGITTPGEPNISSTLWRTVADHKNLRYFYESVLTPNTFWINLRELDFSAGTPYKKIPLNNGEIYAGNVSEKFKPTEPLKFMEVSGKVKSNH